MPSFKVSFCLLFLAPPLVILSAAAFAILVILYRIYETRVEQPKKLEDEVREALGRLPSPKSNPSSRYARRRWPSPMPPTRSSSSAISAKKPARLYTVNDLIGIEVFVNADKMRGPRPAPRAAQDAGRYRAGSAPRHYTPDFRRSVASRLRVGIMTGSARRPDRPRRRAARRHGNRAQVVLSHRSDHKTAAATRGQTRADVAAARTRAGQDSPAVAEATTPVLPPAAHCTAPQVRRRCAERTDDPLYLTTYPTRRSW